LAMFANGASSWGRRAVEETTSKLAQIRNPLLWAGIPRDQLHALLDETRSYMLVLRGVNESHGSQILLSCRFADTVRFWDRFSETFCGDAAFYNMPRFGIAIGKITASDQGAQLQLASEDSKCTWTVADDEGDERRDEETKVMSNFGRTKIVDLSGEEVSYITKPGSQTLQFAPHLTAWQAKRPLETITLYRVELPALGKTINTFNGTWLPHIRVWDYQGTCRTTGEAVKRRILKYIGSELLRDSVAQRFNCGNA